MNVHLLAEMVAGSAPERVVVGSGDDGLTAAHLLERPPGGGVDPAT